MCAGCVLAAAYCHPRT